MLARATPGTPSAREPRLSPRRRAGSVSTLMTILHAAPNSAQRVHVVDLLARRDRQRTLHGFPPHDERTSPGSCLAGAVAVQMRAGEEG